MGMPKGIGHLGGDAHCLIHRQLLLPVIRGENNITAPEVVVRTRVQKQVGGYLATLPHTADQEMWMRLAAHADVGFLRGPDQALYRVHGKNMRKSFDGLRDLRQKRLAFQVTLEQSGHQLNEPKDLSDRVHRRLSREALRAAADAYDRGDDEALVREYEDFALDCWPGATRFSSYRALRLRRRLGRRATPVMTRLSVPSAFALKAYRHLQRRGWKYRGY